MVKLYYADTSLVEDPKVFELLIKQMNTQRRNKILRYKNEQDKNRSLLAGYLLKQALEEEGYSYETLAFSQTKDGKPILVSHPEICFNISHAGRFAVCVLSEKPVGVDIESNTHSIFQEKQVDKLKKIAKKSMSPEEWDIFSKHKKTEQQDLFLQYWTRKESYSKAIGKGLGLEFNSINTEKMKHSYWSDWIEDGYYLSIYREDGDFSNLQMKKIVSI